MALRHYETALARVEMEKLSEYVVDTYGVGGYLPPGYGQAFFEMEKEAVLKTIGGWAAKGAQNVGKFIKGSGAKATAAATDVAPGAHVPGTTRTHYGQRLEDAATGALKDDATRQAIGAGVIGTGVATTALGAGYLAGRK